MEGTGFKQLANTLIEIGAKYGKIDAAALLPCGRTVSRHLTNAADAERATLKEELAQVTRFGVTTDLWTHEATQTPYITVTVQYVTSQWDLRCRILATRSLEERHTAANIQQIVQSLLEEFNASRPDNVYVTDNGANVKAAFREKMWLGCSGHNLNLVVTHTLEANDDDASSIQDITELIAKCKQIVAHVKRSRIHSKLETTVKQAVATRWNSTLAMLNSVASSMDCIKQAAAELNDKKAQRLLLDINEATLNDVIKVLEPFDQATRVLSTDLTPSLHLVVPTRYQLMKQLTININDSPTVSLLKGRFKLYMQSHFQLTRLHCAATLLDPRIKNKANILDDNVKAQAVCDIKQLVANVTEQPTAAAAIIAPSAENEDFTVVPAVKRPRTNMCDSFLNDFFATSAVPTEQFVDEVENYMAMPFSTTDVADNNILHFWQTKSNTWPKLAQVVRGLLAVPASSTSSERSFSIAGRTLDDRRTQLTCEHVDDLMFLHGLKSDVK